MLRIIFISSVLIFFSIFRLPFEPERFDYDDFSDFCAMFRAAAYQPPKFPESIAEEQVAVQARLDALVQALMNEDVDAAVELCSKRKLYRKVFSSNREKLPELGAVLKKARLTSVSPYGSTKSRIGELSVDVGSCTFAIGVAKYYGLWFFEGL